MFVKTLVLSLALLVALVSAVHHRDLSNRSPHHHALVARSSLLERDQQLKARSAIRRCKAHSSTKSAKPTVKAAATTTHAPPKTTHAAPPPPPPPKPSPKSNSGGGGGGGGQHSGGVATYFYQNGVAGACGTVHSDSDLICAMDSAIYNGGALCGKSVTITNTANGNTVTVIVADECPTCDNANSIDLSTGAFNHLAPESVGQVEITWTMS